MTATGKISRRRFIITSIIVVAGLVLSVFAFIPFEYVIRRIIKNDLKALAISDDIIQSFIQDAKSNGYFRQMDRRKKWLIRIYDRLPVNWISFPYEGKYKEYRSLIIADFLMSTDFFMNKMNPDKEIKYIGFYDPYMRPCSNPFSNLFYSRQ
jgi:hypothetical protein